MKEKASTLLPEYGQLMTTLDYMERVGQQDTVEYANLLAALRVIIDKEFKRPDEHSLLDPKTI